MSLQFNNEIQLSSEFEKNKNIKLFKNKMFLYIANNK